jgi:DNA end-binding protein Ku
MARAVWSGSISFGLVNVPVKAYTAVREHKISFNQLEKDSGARIRYEKVSEDSGERVEPRDIELGYEIRKGRYVTFDQSELDELRPESTRAVEVTEFVALEEIDPIYYERTYWLAPDGEAAEKAYQLLRAAMEERQRVGIGTVVMRNKQYLTAIRPLDGVLAMSTMRFADEIVSQSETDELPSRRSKPEAKAVRLAVQIVDSLAAEWDPERYRDTYTDQLRTIIERKDKGKDAVVEKAPAQQAEVLDLMAALEASVSATKAAGKGARAKALERAAEELAEQADGGVGEKGKGRKATRRPSTARKRATRRKSA